MALFDSVRNQIAWIFRMNWELEHTHVASSAATTGLRSRLASLTGVQLGSPRVVSPANKQAPSRTGSARRVKYFGRGRRLFLDQAWRACGSWPRLPANSRTSPDSPPASVTSLFPATFPEGMRRTKVLTCSLVSLTVEHKGRTSALPIAIGLILLRCKKNGEAGGSVEVGRSEYTRVMEQQAALPFQHDFTSGHWLYHGDYSRVWRCRWRTSRHSFSFSFSLTWFPEWIPLPSWRTRGNRGSCQSQSSDEQRPSGGNARKPTLLRWDLAIFWASCHALWCRAYLRRRVSRGGAGGEAPTTPTPTSRRTCAPWRGVTRARYSLYANPDSPSTDRDTWASVPSSPLSSVPHLRRFREVHSPASAMAVTTTMTRTMMTIATWRFSWHWSSIDFSHEFGYEFWGK